MHYSPTAGFTLIEILVVLVIVGLLAGIAVPNLQRMVQRVEISSQRETLIGEIAGLSYRAYVTGQSLTLASTPIKPSSDGKPFPFHLPQGWLLEIPQPITYTFNGMCSGGMVILIAPDKSQEVLRLNPPRCTVTPATE